MRSRAAASTAKARKIDVSDKLKWTLILGPGAKLETGRSV